MALFRILSVIIAFIPAVLFLRSAVSEHLSSPNPELSQRGISLAARITDENARYHYLAGLLAYTVHDKPALEKAVGHYLLSLKRNPADGQAWLAAARAYRDDGRKENAEYAARKAAFVDRNNPGLIWEAGVFFLLEDRAEEAARLFRRYITMVPEDQESVYSLCYMMGVDPAHILGNLVPADYKFYRRYLNYLAANRLLSESLDVWEKMKALGPGKADFLGYIDFLIGSGEIEKALAQWSDFIRRFRLIEGNREGDEYQSDDYLWNGDFELPIENGGFDWRIGRSGEVRIFRDRDIRRTGDASLSVNFDGSSNPGIYIARQIVPVGPGKRYALSGYIKTERITTQNGVLFEVSGLRCGPFVTKTDPVTGTNMWKKIALEFTAPGACKALMVGIKREKSAKFDNKISGDVWLESLTMTEAKGK